MGEKRKKINSMKANLTNDENFYWTDTKTPIFLHLPA
jgi:hypothetical protein